MKPLPWSFSALKNFLSCPRKYYRTRVLKDVKEEWGEATVWGDRVHKAFEAYLRDGTALDPELSFYESYLQAIKAQSGELHIEHELALNTRLEPCNWFADDVWTRAKIDVLTIDGETARAIDHKTGKRKLDPTVDQLAINALLIFIHYPEVEKVSCGYFWLKEKKRDVKHYTRNDITRLWGNLLPSLNEYATAHKEERFVPRQSGLCRGWCPVKDCEFWSPKKNG